MKIIDWIKPGIWIEGLDQTEARRISGQIDFLEFSVEEAIIVLDMFEQSLDAERNSRDNIAELEAQERISREVEAELSPHGMTSSNQTAEDSRKKYSERRTQIDAEVRRRLWKSGFKPRIFLTRPPFIFAKAFIHSLDLFGKFLNDIAQDHSSPKNISTISDQFFKEVPDLKEVRNSIQHAEDRSKGMVWNKEIDLKPIDMEKISIQGAALVSMGLNGRKFGTTMADGHYGAIDITEDTVVIMRTALLAVYSEFEWTGGAQLFPR